MKEARLSSSGAGIRSSLLGEPGVKPAQASSLLPLSSFVPSGRCPSLDPEGPCRSIGLSLCLLILSCVSSLESALTPPAILPLQFSDADTA